MSLIFYYAPQSSAGPIHWTLEELGVPYEKVKLDLKAEQQKQPAFLKLNPNGKVPLLVHDGVPIFESVAIQIHLGETFGVAKGLYPAPGPHRGEALKWLVWTNVNLGEAVSRYWRNASDRAPAELRNAKAGEQARKDISGLLTILDHQLSDRPYLLGEGFSLADLHLSSWLDYLRMTGIDLAPHKNITPWMARCTERPAYARAS